MSQLRETGLSVLNVESTPEVFIVTPFTQTPFDVLEAVANLGLGRYEQVVLLEIQKQIYGPSKASVANISQADISRFYGAKRQNISRGLQSLLKLRIIVQQGGGYRFNTVASEWTVNGQTIPSFASQIITTADHPSVDVIKSDYKSVIKSDDIHADRVIKSDDKASEVVIISDDKSTHPESACNQNRLHVSSNLMTNVIKNDDTSSIEKNLERKTESPQPQIQQPIQPEASPTPERSPFWEPKTDSELWQWVEEQDFDTMGLEGTQLSGTCRTYTIRWVYYALRIAVQREIVQPKGFIGKILREWHAKGQKAIHAGGHASSTPWIDYERIKLDEPEDDDDEKPLTIEQRRENNRKLLEAKAEKDRKVAEIMERVNREMAEKRAKLGVAV